MTPSSKIGKETMIFDPDDRSLIRHAKSGVWDIYGDISAKARRRIFRLPFLSKAKIIGEAYEGYPHVARMVRDIATLEGCGGYFVAWFGLRFVSSFMPAISLWYTGQLLRMVGVLPLLILQGLTILF